MICRILEEYALVPIHDTDRMAADYAGRLPTSGDSIQLMRSDPARS